MSIKFFDMFSGIGGFRSGLEAIDGFECIGYCEIDKYAKKAYEAMYNTEGEVYFEDARTINPSDLPDMDLIVGGFPCQAFPDNMLLGLGVMLSANEVPRIAEQFGLDSSVKVNMMSVVHATTTAVNLTRSVARAAS